MRDGFLRYHPIVNNVFFLTVMTGTVVSYHPVILSLSFLCAFLYLLILKGFCGAMKSVGFAFFFAFIAMVINPLFNHYGVTVLFFLPGGNPFTLESVCFGMAAGLMLMAVLSWFSCLSVIMTTDRYIYIFGRIAPVAALILSMAMRFIPLLSQKNREIEKAHKGIGRIGGLGTEKLSALTSFALENGIHVSASMQARGYGKGRRSAYSLYRFRRADMGCLVYMVTAGLIYAVGVIKGCTNMSFNPVIKAAGPDDMTAFVLTCAGFFMLCMMPVFMFARDSFGRYTSRRNIMLRKITENTVDAIQGNDEVNRTVVDDVNGVEKGRFRLWEL